MKANGKSTSQLSAEVKNEFCAITVSSLDDKPLSRSATLLLTACARWQNTGAEWNDRRTLWTKYGEAPTLIEPVKGWLTLHEIEGAVGLQLIPLDGAARPMGEPIRGQATGKRLGNSARRPGHDLVPGPRDPLDAGKIISIKPMSMMQEFTALDGAILIDKPAGPTSHDVVDAIRRQFGIKKVGHCGTLDPNATGLLIIVLGRGTKLSEKLMADDKVYEGTIKFGETTNSYDADGELVASLPVPPLTLEQLNAAAAEFVGDHDANAADGFGGKEGRRAALQTGAQRDRGAARAAADSHLHVSLQRTTRSRSASSASPAPRAPTSAASRTSWAKNSAAARTSPRCAA